LEYDQYRAITAVNGFRILGSEANPALPELQRLADNAKAPETAIRATQCLILMTQRFLASTRLFINRRAPSPQRAPVLSRLPV